MPATTATFGWIERLRQGDTGAFTPLFEHYRPRLALLIHYRASPRLRSLVEVDDLVQETMLRASRQIDQFSYRGPGSFMHWLSRIAEHVIVDEARFHGRAKRQRGEEVPLRSESNPGGAEPAVSLTPSRIFERGEALRRLLDALETLPDNYRQAILLSRVECLRTDEVAKRMGKSRDAVAVLLHRALHRLREALGEAEEP